MKKYIFVFSIVTLGYGCSHKIASSKSVQQKTAATNVQLVFENVAGGQSLKLNDGHYTNSSGENFSVSLLQYFISNISLKRTDGAIITIPKDDSYFLIKESDPESHKVNLQVPDGKYESISFVLGVDSFKSTRPIEERTGILDPISYKGEENMYWGWNSGYIFFKMEGNSESAPADKAGNHKFRYHIGLFGGMSSPTVNNIKIITLDLANKDILNVSSSKIVTVDIAADILKMFEGNTNISIAKNSTVMVSPFSVNVANNYAGMFTLIDTKN